MQLFSIETGNFMLDGGAIFGVVPKTLWEKQYPSDNKNLINLAMRCLLVVEGDRKILIDTGMGNKQSEKFFGYYYPNGDDTLDKSLQKVGIRHDEITDVILTHLHFDHCGGAVKINEKEETVPAFPNAKYIVGKSQWENSLNPNAREKSSYFNENILPLKDKIILIDQNTAYSDFIELRIFNGHTIGQLVPIINANGKRIVYTADLIPVASQVPISWITAYDIEPLVMLKEKQEFLEEAATNDYLLFFEHDIRHECATLRKTEKGIRIREFITLKEFCKDNQGFLQQPGNLA